MKRRIYRFSEYINESTKLADVLKTNDPDLETKYQSSEFKIDDDLIGYVFIPETRKVINIKWNINDVGKKHSMFKRIEERTSFDSISEFNKYFEKLIVHIFRYKRKFLNSKNKDYAIFSRSMNISFVCKIDFKNWKNKGTADIFVITILNALVKDVDQVIKINDFNL